MRKLILFLLLLVGCKEHKLPKLAHIHVYCIKNMALNRFECANLFPDRINERKLQKNEIIGWVDARRYEDVLPPAYQSRCTVKTEQVVYTNADCIFTGGYIPEQEDK